jgi:hypothetical protein
MEDLSVDGRMVLECIFRKPDGGVKLIDLAQDRDICDHGEGSVVSVKCGKCRD